MTIARLLLSMTAALIRGYLSSEKECRPLQIHWDSTGRVPCSGSRVIAMMKLTTSRGMVIR